jgi:hypothetical protein
MKEKLVKTIKGEDRNEKDCRLIDGQYYYIGDIHRENSGDIYLINNRYIRASTERIVFDHFEGEYKLKNSSLTHGIIDIEDGTPVFGYFSKNDLYNVKVIVKDLSERVAISANVLGYEFRERRSDGVFYHISLLDANKFNLLRGISREIKESFPYDSKGSIAKITKTFESNYKPVICRNAEIVGKTLKDYTFGLEFETCAGIIPNNKLVYLPLIPLRDGSISGIEYATIPLKGPVGVQALIDSVDELKRRTSYSDECSLHIHVGGMPRTTEYILAFYKTISLLQNDIFSMFPLYKKYNFGVKRKNYSAPFPFEEINFRMDPIINYNDKKQVNKNFDHLFTYLSGGVTFAEYGNDLSQVLVHPQDPQGAAKWNIKHRYSFVNLIPLIFGNHQTIEFRIHTPTYDINKILDFLMLNIYIIDYVNINYKLILAGKDTLSIMRPSLQFMLNDYVNNIEGSSRKTIFNELNRYISERKHASEDIARTKGVVYQEEDLRLPKGLGFNTYKYHRSNGSYFSASYLEDILYESSLSSFDSPFAEASIKFEDVNPSAKLKLRSDVGVSPKRRPRDLAREKEVLESSRKALEQIQASEKERLDKGLGGGLYEQMRQAAEIRYSLKDNGTRPVISDPGTLSGLGVSTFGTSGSVQVKESSYDWTLKASKSNDDWEESIHKPE